jgi:hypothetical protein
MFATRERSLHESRVAQRLSWNALSSRSVVQTDLWSSPPYNGKLCLAYMNRGHLHLRFSASLASMSSKRWAGVLEIAWLRVCPARTWTVVDARAFFVCIFVNTTMSKSAYVGD